MIVCMNCGAWFWPTCNAQVCGRCWIRTAPANDNAVANDIGSVIRPALALGAILSLYDARARARIGRDVERTWVLSDQLGRRVVPLSDAQYAAFRAALEWRQGLQFRAWRTTQTAVASTEMAVAA